MTALNAFPLFELMLRIKEPSRLPGMSMVLCMGEMTDLAAGVSFALLSIPSASVSYGQTYPISHALRFQVRIFCITGSELTAELPEIVLGHSETFQKHMRLVSLDASRYIPETTRLFKEGARTTMTSVEP